MSERDDRNARLGFAQTLKTSGLMVVLLCGLCTATCAGPAAYNHALGRGGGETFYLGLAAVIGGVPIALGLVLLIGGVLTERAIRRERASRPPPSSPPRR